LLRRKGRSVCRRASQISEDQDQLCGASSTMGNPSAKTHAFQAASGLNRQARRAEASTRRRRLKSILQFNRDIRASGNCLETYCVTIADFGGLFGLMATGDPTAELLVTAISRWAEEAEREPSAKPLCLDCDTMFGPSAASPIAFSVTVPLVDRSRAMVAGICRSCASKGKVEMEQATLRRLRIVWPSAYSIGKFGRA
jgi:hypothetical protein